MKRSKARLRAKYALTMCSASVRNRTVTTNRPRRLRIRRWIARGSSRPFQAYIVDWTTRNTANPQAKDIARNSGISSAVP
jgi:hypothetical protein